MKLRELFMPKAATTSTPQIDTNDKASSVAELLANFGISGSGSASGVRVTVDSALQVSAVYACVDRVAGAIKTLPFRVFERSEDGSHGGVDHPYNWMFNERASTWWSSSDAWSFLVACKLLYGDGYARLLRKDYRQSEVTGWEPIHPQNISLIKDDAGNKFYRVMDGGKPQAVPPEDIVQVTSLGFDGKSSPSPIEWAGAEVLGQAIASQRYQSSFFRDGATFDYVLSTPMHMTKEQVAQLREQYSAKRAGSRMPLVLTGDVKPAQLSINPRDAELMAQRSFSVEEICRIFGVPPHMVGHTEKSTSWQSGLESMGTSFVRYTLMPHLVQIQQAFNHRLWPRTSRYFCEHVTAALERGDIKSRNEAYRVALGRAGEPGWMTVNEIRRKENMPPVDGGDEINKGLDKQAPKEQANA